jgi:hypothetical protein
MTEARYDSLRTIAFGSITNSYQPLGLVIAHNWRVWKITNNTNGDMLISFDGTNDNIFIPAYSYTLYDITTNSDQNAAEGLKMSVGTQWLIKYSTAPTIGSVYLEGAYQKGQ